MSGSEMHEASGVASGPGSRPADGAAQEGVSTPAGASIPNAVFVVAVTLCKRTMAGEARSVTQSWSAGSRDSAIVRALEFSQKAKPDFSIEQWIVVEIPLPVVEIDDGARTAPRYAADLIRSLDPGRNGLIWNLERLADHLDACSAQAIEARRAATGTGAVEDESAVPEGCAQGEQP